MVATGEGSNLKAKRVLFIHFRSIWSCNGYCRTRLTINTRSGGTWRKGKRVESEKLHEICNEDFWAVKQMLPPEPKRGRTKRASVANADHFSIFHAFLLLGSSYLGWIYCPSHHLQQRLPMGSISFRYLFCKHGQSADEINYILDHGWCWVTINSFCTNSIFR